MKKFLFVLVSMALAISFVGCSSEQDAPASEEQNISTQDEQRFDIDEITSDDGVEFLPDLTKKGNLAKSPLSSNEIELCGKTYTMPIKISDLISDGWELAPVSFKNEFKPKTRTRLASFSMKNKDGAFISLGEIYNDSDSVQKLEDCLLTELNMSYLNSDSTKVDFVFPGGVTKESTAGDIVSVYGDPNNSKIFVDHSYNLENQLSYNGHQKSEMSFSYSFEEDGALKYAKVSVAVE